MVYMPRRNHQRIAQEGNRDAVPRYIRLIRGGMLVGDHARSSLRIHASADGSLLLRCFSAEQPSLEGITNRERRPRRLFWYLWVPLDSPAKLRATLPHKCRILCPSDRKAVDFALPLDTALVVSHWMQALLIFGHLDSTFAVQPFHRSVS